MNERIKKLRSEILGLTMEEFGERVGVTRSAISNIESGRRNVSEQIIKAICREFAVREDWIRNGEGIPMLSSENAEIDSLVRKYDLSELDRIILNKWMALSSDQREVLDDFILSVFSDYSEASAPAAPIAPDHVLDPSTATDEEKLDAYERYLTERKKAEGE